MHSQSIPLPLAIKSYIKIMFFIVLEVESKMGHIHGPW